MGPDEQGRALTWADYSQTQARNAPRWQTGGQWGSTDNGYDSPFYSTFFRQQEEEANRNNLHNLYQRRDFTGIVTYNGSRDAQGRETKAGDIYENGQRTGNLYQQYNRADATQILADLTLSPEARRQAYQEQAGGDLHAVERMVQKTIESESTRMGRVATQVKYDREVESRKSDLEKGWLDEVLTAGAGAAGGALTMWWAGPWGWAAGAIGGGTAALMNQDEILDQTARALVQKDMAYQEYGLAGAIPTGLMGFSGLAGKFVQPLQNLTHGIYDAYAGEIGDGKSAWYVNQDGTPSTRPAWVTGMGVVAGLGDAALLFGSGVGAATYQIQMGTQIGGAVTQLVGTGGSRFSDYHGEFDSIFTDDDGNFDPGAAAAGIGSIGIDAVQMVTARGLTNMYRSRAGLTQNVEAGGRLFTRNADGTMRYARGSGDGHLSAAMSTRMSVLAPSEMLTAVSSRVGALRLARLEGRATISADDFYRAATRLSDQQGLWVSSLVTGVGEGYEEFIQSVLDPISHNAAIDWEDAFEAALHGFAMGTGMQLGSGLRNYGTRQNPSYARSKDEQNYQRAAFSRWTMAGADETVLPEQVLTREQWNKMSPTARTAAANLSKAEEKLYQEALANIQEQQAATQVAGRAGIDKVRDAVRAQIVADAAKAGPRVDGSFVISQANDADWGGEAVVASFGQVESLLRDSAKGLLSQIAHLERVDLPSGDAGVVARAEAQIALAQATRNETLVLAGLVEDLHLQAKEARKQRDTRKFWLAVDRTNEILRSAYERGVFDPTAPKDSSGDLTNARMRAASLLFVRNPQDQTGSYPLLMPQVDFRLAYTNSDGVLLVSPAILQAIGGDHDGDKITHQAKIILDEQSFLDQRTGRHLIGAVTNADGQTTVNIATRDYERAEVAVLSRAASSADDVLANTAATNIAELAQRLRDRYAGVVPANLLERALQRMKDSLLDGDSSARENLLADILDYGGAAFLQFARDNYSNEFFWIDREYQLMLQVFQRWYANHTATENPYVNSKSLMVKRGSKAWQRQVRWAATEGQTLALRAEGSTLFRMVQKLHYSVVNAAVVGNEPGSLDAALADLQMLYEQLSQGMTQDALEAAGARDSIAQGVLHQLQQIAQNSDTPNRDIVLLGQMEMANIVEVQGDLRLDGKISLVQMLLRQEIRRDQRDKAAVVTPELQAKWRALENLTKPGNAGEAFVAMLGGMTLYELMGEASSALGPHLTVEQFVRIYSSQGEQGRRVSSQRMRKEPAYGEARKEGQKDAPYEWDRIRNNEITTYRAVVEALTEAGNNRNKRLRERSDAYQEALEESFRNIETVFREAGWSRTDPATIRMALDTYPELGRAIYELIPDRDVNGAFQEVNGELRVSQWFVTMLSLPPEQAAMHYWRNILLAQWHSLGARHGEAEDGEGMSRTYRSLNNRIHQLMYRLSREQDGGLSYLEFTKRLNAATSVQDFVDYLNQNHLSPREAPYVAWVNDVAEFSPDKPNGGWSNTATGSLQREAILMLKQKSENMITAIRNERLSAEADNMLMSSLRGALRDGKKANDGEGRLLVQLEEALEFSRSMLTSLGPQATRDMLLGSQMTFYGQAHTKGQSPTVYAAHGALQALADIPGYATAYERLRDTLISVDAEDATSNPQAYMQDDFDTMDESGRSIEWSRLTTEKFLDLWHSQPETRPLLRAMIFPSVYEKTPSGVLTQKFLTGLSVKELLERGTYNSFFQNSTESKFTYLSLLDSQAKLEGELFTSSRYINDILLAHTSGATHRLSEADHRGRIDDMMGTMAQIGRLVGSVGSEQGTATLDAIRETLTKELMNRRDAASLELSKTDREAVTNALTLELKHKVGDVREMARQAFEAGEHARGEKLADYADRLERKTLGVLSSAGFMRFRNEVSITGKDQAEIDQRKMNLRSYFASRPSLLTKVPWATAEIHALLNPANEVAGVPVLHRNAATEQKMWDLLADAATAAYLEAETSVQADGIAVPNLLLDKAFSRRYMDPTFSYLLDFLDPKGAFAKTAIKLHRKNYGSGHLEGNETQLMNLIRDTVLNEDRLGEWTVDVARASIEANQRLDSSAAPDGVASSGFAPRRQMVVSTATQRTTRTDTLDATVSTGVIPLDLLASRQGNFYTSLVTEAGTVPNVETPMYLLNGRFARGARIVNSKTKEVIADLWANAVPRLGRIDVARPEVGASGYRAVTLRELNRAVEAATTTLENLDDLVLELDYLHPDSQPARDGYYNSLFYEGVSFEADDMERSLISTLWFSHGSISPMSQSAALQANKKGKLAYALGKAFTSKTRKALEETFATDFSGMLMAKATELIQQDLGAGVLDKTFFNAVLKDVKMRHFVRGNLAGEDIAGKSSSVLLTAEEVIEWQRANPGRSLTEIMPDAKLWKPSIRVLRTMLGETGDQGVAGALQLYVEPDPSAIKQYQGLTKEHLARVPRWDRNDGDLLHSSAAASTVQSRLRISPIHTAKEQRQLMDAVQYAQGLKLRVLLARKEKWSEGAAAAQGREVKGLIEEAINSETPGFDLAQFFPFLGSLHKADQSVSQLVFHELAEAQALRGHETGWNYVETFRGVDRTDLTAGVVTQISLDPKEKGYTERPLAEQIAPGDIVNFGLSQFQENIPDSKKRTRTVRQRLDALAARRPIIALTDATGAREARLDAARYLETIGYEKIAGSKHLYQPVVRDSEYQTREARISTLTDTYTQDAQNIMVAFLAGRDTPLPYTENAAAFVSRNPRRTIALPLGLMPTNPFGTFNRPQGPDQVARVKAEVEHLLEDTNFTHLLKLSKIDDPRGARASALRKAIEKYLGNADANGMPAAGTKFGQGDIVPLVDRHGRILLYRHGMKAPRDVEQQLKEPLVEGEAYRNIAIYSPEPESAATTYTGEVIEFTRDSQYGLRVSLRVPLQDLGNKIQFEANGMKYVLTTDGGKKYLPKHELFSNGVGIDLISDLDAAMSKESTGGLVNNFRNAFAFFGIDFVPDLTKFFTGLDYADMDTDGQERAHALVTRILERINRGSDGVNTRAVYELLQAPYLDTQLETLLKGMSLSELAPGLNTDWVGEIFAADETADHATRIGRAAVLYMLLPSARPEHILRAGGLNNPGVRTDGSQTVFMPRLFTEVFDNLPLGDPLRQELITRLNGQINNKDAKGKQAYWLSPDFTFSMRNSFGEQIDGMIQFSKAFPSGDNPVLDRQAFARSTQQNWSVHSLDMAFQAIGGRTAADNGMEKTERFTRLRDISTGSMWQLLNDVPQRDGAAPMFMQERPGEQARRQQAYDAVGAFRHEHEMQDWTDAEKDSYRLERNRVGELYGLTPEQSKTLDFWARQMYGMPHGLDDKGNELGQFRHQWAMNALEEIAWNATHGLLPTAGAEVPQIHLHDLAMIFDANKGSGARFHLVEGPMEKTPVTSWEGYVEVALGTGQIEHKVFDPMFLLATDGFMHSFQDALDSLVSLPVSRDMLVTAKMMDPTTDRLLASLDPNTDAMLRDPMLLEADQVTFQQLMGLDRLADGSRDHRPPASDLARRRAERMKWRKENGVPVPLSVTMRNFREVGARYVEESPNAPAIMRILTNLRVGNALLNPLLWVAAGPEMWNRMILDDATNLLMGQSTGRLGRGLAESGASKYTPEQITQLLSLYRTLGSRKDFKGMIYKDLMFKQPSLNNAGRIERWTAAYARFGGSWQDPTYGLTGYAMARRYIEKVLEELPYYAADYSIDQVIAHLNADPTWVQRNLEPVHRAASNTIANMRSLRPTIWSLALRGIYEPASSSAYLPVNMLGHVLKIPAIFSGYLMNVMTTVTGTQGLSNMVAMFMEGRNKGLIGRIQAAIKGAEYDAASNTVDGKDNVFDMSTALDGINLSKMFIQGGLTHTGLFALGLAAGGLGLSGEDEEERRRRRVAQTTGGQFLYDPRRLQNDFRNAQTIYLDWLPMGLSSLFETGGEDGRAMAHLPWIFRQFISPIIGMERFLANGDPKEILWGFEDAIGAMPLFNASMIDNAGRAYAELMASADEVARSGAPDALPQAYGLMVAAVGTLERMLFENSFVNMIYTQQDAYDRDPWKRPLTDSDGDIQYDLMGNPRATSALSNFVDPTTGEVRAGYENRSWESATLHQLTESRLSLALLSSLITGQGIGGSTLRNNMVAKQRVIEKPELSMTEAEGLFLTVMDTESYGRSTELLTELGARGVFNSLYTGAIGFDSPALEGVYVPLDMRQAIQDKWMAELVTQNLLAGMSPRQAERHMWDVWRGTGDSPYGMAISDVLWSRDIPYTSTVRYNQLNTTYVMGPNGMPYATGVTLNAATFGLLPQRYRTSGEANLPVDGRLNSIDEAVRLNTGMRALERIDDSWMVPTDAEIGESIAKSLDALAENVEKLLDDSGYGRGYGGGRRGWVNYPRRSGWSRSRGGGYGGGYGGSYYGSTYVPNYGGNPPRFSAQRRVRSPQTDDLYTVNTSNPIIRRASIRRERFASERGRLNQWQ